MIVVGWYQCLFVWSGNHVGNCLFKVTESKQWSILGPGQVSYK